MSPATRTSCRVNVMAVDRSILRIQKTACALLLCLTSSGCSSSRQFAFNIERVCLESGGAVKIKNTGYPIWLIGFSSAFYAKCEVPNEDGEQLDGRGFPAYEDWVSRRFKYSLDERGELGLAVENLEPSEARERMMGFFAGLRGGTASVGERSDAFSTGFAAAVRARREGFLEPEEGLWARRAER